MGPSQCLRPVGKEKRKKRRGSMTGPEIGLVVDPFGKYTEKQLKTLNL